MMAFSIIGMTPPSYDGKIFLNLFWTSCFYFFSCEAQLNTCTFLSVCLSVYPSVSKLDFSPFGQLKTTYDKL